MFPIILSWKRVRRVRLGSLNIVGRDLPIVFYNCFSLFSRLNNIPYNCDYLQCVYSNQFLSMKNSPAL